ncbi:MAG TPA: extracellular solute-binding protein [Thermohalobaculum sp.]|nr:extracellular solute-binding protein [Thermohalobaculum sp.]
MMNRTIAAAAAALAAAGTAFAAEQSIIVQSTTSTHASGLYDHLLPAFEEETGIDVRVVAVGTGQAIRNAENCDGDVLLVHARPAEERFVEEGHGVERHDLMYNDFVIVGPPADPAGIAGTTDAPAALAAIAAAEAPFASRGDDSGTHKAELALWQEAGIDPSAGSGGWYLEAGSGMGATLNTAVGMEAYALTDRATWTSFRNKGRSGVMVEGDPELFNQYGVIVVNPKKCPSVNAEAARTFVDWLLSEEGQQAIGAYRLEGEPLFTPNAKTAM